MAIAGSVEIAFAIAEETKGIRCDRCRGDGTGENAAGIPLMPYHRWVELTLELQHKGDQEPAHQCTAPDGRVRVSAWRRCHRRHQNGRGRRLP